MFKLKFYLWNALWSGLIGLAVNVAGLLIWVWHNSFSELGHFIVEQQPQIFLVLFYNMLFCMAVGAVIGTVSLFFFFQIFLKFTEKPVFGYLSNFIVVAVLNMAGAVMTGLWSYDLFRKGFFSSIWFVALIVSEVLSFFLTFLWRQRIMLYKTKLEEKKALLRN